MKPSNLRDLAKRYLAGESLFKLGKELGVQDSTVGRWLEKENIKLRRKAEAMRMDRLRLDDASICARYSAGESENAIAKSLGVPRHTIRRRVLRAGLKARGRSDAERVKWAQMSPNQRMEQVAAAHASVTGRNEADLLYVLSLAGYDFKKTRVGKYHVDMAIHEPAVAIEVESSDGFLNEYKRERLKYILNKGWAVLFVRVNRSVHIRPITEKVIAFLKLTGRDNALAGKYGVINGKGESATIHSKKLTGVTRVEGF